MAWFYGVEGIEFIWHGEWNDPECEYRGVRFNYYALEDALYAEYRDEFEAEGLDTPEGMFNDWVFIHKDYALYFADLIVEAIIEEEAEQLRKGIDVKHVSNEICNILGV